MIEQEKLCEGDLDSIIMTLIRLEGQSAKARLNFPKLVRKLQALDSYKKEFDVRFVDGFYIGSNFNMIKFSEVEMGDYWKRYKYAYYIEPYDYNLYRVSKIYESIASYKVAAVSVTKREHIIYKSNQNALNVAKEYHQNDSNLMAIEVTSDNIAEYDSYEKIKNSGITIVNINDIKEDN